MTAVFDSVEAATRIMSYFQNFEFEGQKMQMGFSSPEASRVVPRREKNVFFSIPNFDMEVEPPLGRANENKPNGSDSGSKFQMF